MAASLGASARPWLTALAFLLAAAWLSAGGTGARPNSIEGAWAGRYVCGQGPTGARLTLSAVDVGDAWLGIEVYLHRLLFGLLTVPYKTPQSAGVDADGIKAVTARFDFDAVPENPSVPRGAYELEGRFDSSNALLYLAPTRWIEEPQGYRMLGIMAILEGETFKGAFDAPECGAVFLKRTTAQAAESPSPSDIRPTTPAQVETTPELDALNLAYVALYNAGSYEEAVAKAGEALALAEQLYGPDSPTIALEIRSLAFALTAMGRSAEAEPLIRRALAIDEKNFGSDHMAVALDVRMLAAALFERRRAMDAEATDRVSLALTGQLSSVLSKAAALAFVVSLLLLYIYRRAVQRSMLRTARPGGDMAQTTSETPPTPNSPAEPLRIVTVDDIASQDQDETLAGPWRSAVIYGAAGLSYAATLIVFYSLAADLEFLPLRFLFLTLAAAWPIVLTLGLVAATSWRGWLTLIALYFAAFAALSIIELAISEKLTWDQPIRLWLLMNLPGTLLTVAFFPRPIRAVGPLVLVLSIAAIAGSVLWFYLLDPRDLLPVVNAFSWLGLVDAQAVDAAAYAAAIAGVLLLGGAGWIVVRGLGRAYRRRLVSDQSMIVDALWLVFALTQAIDFAFFGTIYFLAPLAAFALYKIATLAGFTLLRGRRADGASDPKLLLLRVFSLGRRSARLFDAFAKLWRHGGSIRLIAGPDLATSTIEPYEFLDFLSGKLARQFVAGPETLHARLAAAEPRRDFDGRYRVSDFFCHDDTWQLVLRRLAKDSDAVLMDLRGFTRDNRGCLFEINELLNVVPLERVIFVVDASTNEEELRDALLQGWSNLAADSPNRKATAPCVTLFRFAGGANGAVKALVAAVARAARAATDCGPHLSPTSARLLT